MTFIIASAVVTDTQLVITCSGNAGAITYTSGAIGVFPRCHINGFWIEFEPSNVASIVGNVVTINLYTPFPKSTTTGIASPVVANSGSQISDGTNFLSGADVTPTNSSTMNVTLMAFDPTTVGMNAFFGDGTDNNSRSIRSISNGAGGTSTLDFSAALTVPSGTGALAVLFESYVGGAPTNPLSIAVGTGSYTTQVNSPFSGTVLPAGLIGTGLSSGTYNVSLKYLTGTLMFPTGAFLMVYNATAVLFQPTSGASNAPSLWGNSFPATTPYTDTSLVQYNATPNTSVTLETGYNSAANTAQGWLITGNAVSAQRDAGPSFGIHYTSKPSGLLLYCNNPGTGTLAGAFGLVIDNGSSGSGSLVMSHINAGFEDFTSIISGVSSGAHDYHFTYAGIPGSSLVGFVRSVGGSVGTPPALRANMTKMYGDSNADSVGPIGVHGKSGALYGWPYKLSLLMKVPYLACALSGSSCMEFTGSGETLDVAAGQYRTSDVTACAHPVIYVVDAYGTNDVRQSGSLNAGRAHGTLSAAITANASAQAFTMNSGVVFTTGQVVQFDIGGPDSQNSPGASYEPVTMTASNTGIFTKNHANASYASRPELLSEFKSAFSSEVAALFAGLGSTAKVIAIGIIPNNDALNGPLYGETSGSVGAANLLAWSFAKRDALAALPQAARTQFIDITSANLAGTAYPSGGAWDGTLYDDASHINDAGHTILANLIYAQMNATSVSHKNLSLLGVG